VKIKPKIKQKLVYSQPDGLQLQEVSDFGGENCLPPQNIACKLRDTTCLASMGRLHLSAEPLFIVGDVCGGKLSLRELN